MKYLFLYIVSSAVMASIEPVRVCIPKETLLGHWTITLLKEDNEYFIHTEYLRNIAPHVYPEEHQYPATKQKLSAQKIRYQSEKCTIDFLSPSKMKVVSCEFSKKAFLKNRDYRCTRPE